MKLRSFLAMFIVVLAIISAFALFTPLLQAYNMNHSLLNGTQANGTTFEYEIGAMGPVNFYHNNTISNDIGNLGLATSYLNITITNGHAFFSVKIYGQPTDSQVLLAKSYSTNVSSSSKLYDSFFPGALDHNGQFVNVFSETAQFTGASNAYSSINVSKGILYSYSEKVNMINVPLQPTGYYGNLSKILSANSAYYINTNSGAFLNHLLLSGNSSIISTILGSSSVSSVTLFYITLQSTNSSVLSLNVSHYIVQYAAIVAVMWIVGSLYIISLYRRQSRRWRK
ncbi:MAG: hypothetical protein B2I17_04535 [Thermoplasmatales archaeon B_DKE]|nr:MAG: hypothetical protein B2I17_04535 [Thermoplasmatales archaeon B_DKE]QRF75735.1 hypothetical protein Thermo_01241 [Thermoplasmatales archaeon]